MLTMRTIYKYPIPSRNRDQQQWEDIETHLGAKILFVAEIESQAYVWLEVETENPTAKIRLWLVGTGRLIPQGTQYLHSIISEFGFVWHVYTLPHNIGGQ